MPQAQLPIFPSGTTQINANLAFEKREGRLTYFYGTLPVFFHDEDDLPTFRMIASQLYINGSATQAELCRTFTVSSISMRRAVKQYREQGAAGFYKPRNTVYFRQPCVNRDLTSTMMHSRGTATPKENLYLPKIFLRDTTKRFRYKVLHGIAIAEQTLQRPVF